VSVGTAACPHAVVAVGIGGEVMLFRDIVKREDPILLKYDQFAGKTYRVLSSCGHLFVFTSKAVYVLGSLASRLTQPSLGENVAPVMTIPMEAIDVNICGNRWLLVVMHDEVHRYDVHQIHDMITEFATNGTGPASPPPQARVNLGDMSSSEWTLGLFPLPQSRPNLGDSQPVKSNARRLQTATG